MLVKGQMTMSGELIKEGEIFIMEPYEVADPEFLEDCVVLCIKAPSLPGDKYIVDSDTKS